MKVGKEGPMLDASYEIDEPQIVSEEFDGEYVILNLSNGTYYSLEASGNMLWSVLMAGAKPSEIIQKMEAAGNEHAAAAKAFYTKVIALGLVRSTGSVEPAGLGSTLRDEVIMIDAPPAVEVFNDLADLILADPVHEADEQAGWPKAKADPS